MQSSCVGISLGSPCLLSQAWGTHRKPPTLHRFRSRMSPFYTLQSVRHKYLFQQDYRATQITWGSILTYLRRTGVSPEGFHSHAVLLYTQGWSRELTGLTWGWSSLCLPYLRWIEGQEVVLWEGEGWGHPQEVFLWLEIYMYTCKGDAI